MGVCRIALVEDRVARLQRLPQIEIERGQPAADDQALVDDRARRRRRHGDLGERPAGGAGGAFETATRDDQAAFEGVVAERARVVSAARGPADDRLDKCRA